MCILEVAWREGTPTSAKGPQIDTQQCRMEKTAALLRCLPAACPLQGLLWLPLCPRHDLATRSPCPLPATLLKLHCPPLKTAPKLTDLAVQPRGHLPPPHLLTVLAPPPQTGPAFPEGAPAEAPSTGNSSGNDAALLTPSHLLHLPTKRAPFHMPEGGRQLASSAKSRPDSFAGIQVKAKPVAEPTPPEAHQGNRKKETKKRPKTPSRVLCGSHGA